MVGPLARRAPGRRVRWGTLRRLEPFSRHYGWERGVPVDRTYIEAFIEREQDAVRGDVLEVKDPDYALRYGQGVTKAHVVDIDRDNPQATIVADLNAASSLPAATFDCAIVTQTLHLIGDIDAALSNLRQALKPEGTLLMTGPCMSMLETRSSDYWRWTPAGLKRLLERNFPGDDVRVEGHGNVLVGVAFLMGLAQAELRETELGYDDPDYPVVVCGRVDLRA
jgi:SAM-dependent methyltransferase